MLAHGVEALSSVELIALVLRSGARGHDVLSLARKLWERFGGLDRIARAGDAELAGVSGLGPAKVASLRAALELGARRAAVPLLRGDRLDGPEQVHAHLAPRLAGLRQERFLTLLLDSRHRVIREVEVSRGSLDQSLVHPREVFGPALRESAAALVLVHNHPSGDPEPSREDREVTRRLEDAGELLGIGILDHVVIGADGYVSFARRGWLPSQVPATRRR
jgi:DNA repair protein RadC